MFFLSQESQDYYGTGESFVFSFHPTFKAHRWTGVNDYFCISSGSWLAMGGGGGGFAFQIDDELDAGESNPSDTFGSPRLSSNEFFRYDARKPHRTAWILYVCMWLLVEF